jgi:hypothetical protein
MLAARFLPVNDAAPGGTKKRHGVTAVAFV